MASMAGVVNTFSTQTSMAAAPINRDRTAVTVGKRDAYTVSEPACGRQAKEPIRRLPESRDRLASRPLTPLTARNVQRGAAGSWEPLRQWRGRPTPFPFPLPRPPIGEKKKQDKKVSERGKE